MATETREFGALLRERRDALGRTAVDLARATSVPRTYIHDCEAGRKWPNRPWIERLAALEPADPSLLVLYDATTARRGATLRRPFGSVAVSLALDLETGAQPPEPLPERPGGAAFVDAAEFVAFKGRSQCLDAALDLLVAAAEKGPLPMGSPEDERYQGMLILDSPSVERSGLPWVSALRDALDARWVVVHLLAPEDDAGRRLQRVRDLLSLVGRPSGAYHPMVAPGPVPDVVPASHLTLETVVVPGVGVLQLYPAAESASFFPWRDDFLHVCRQIALAAHTVQAASIPLVTVYQAEAPPPAGGGDPPGGVDDLDRFRRELRQLPPKVAFDTAVTEAVARGGRRALIKAGFVLPCMPPQSTLDFSTRLKRRAERADMPEYIPLIEILTGNRRQRRQALRQFPSRDICTEGALQTYLDPEPTLGASYQQHDPLSSELTFADRVAHVRGVIDLLETSPCYEVALAATPELIPVPVGPWYWMATETALFFIGPRPDGTGTRYVIIRDAVVVEAFFQLFDDCWDSIDEPHRSRDAVVARLKAMVDQAEATHGRRASAVSVS